MALTASRYGKDRVRVMRLTAPATTMSRGADALRAPDRRFEAAWTEGDNRACIATDSVKNIVNVTAARNLSLDAEGFAWRWRRSCSRPIRRWRP